MITFRLCTSRIARAICIKILHSSSSASNLFDCYKDFISYIKSPPSQYSITIYKNEFDLSIIRS